MKKYRPISNFGEPLQSAYRPLHGTGMALLRIKNDILGIIDDHNAVALVLDGLAPIPILQLKTFTSYICAVIVEVSPFLYRK